MLKALAGAAALWIAAVAAVPAVAAPPKWTPVKATSHISFSGTHAGNRFEGRFGAWAANIRFDPADLAHSVANVVIATPSATTGDKLQETTLAQAEWFDVANHPRATFVTSRITAAGPGRYVADGTLTIRGKAVPVKLPFTLMINGSTATMAGRVAVDRLAFGIGAKTDPSAAFVSRSITISVNLTAKRGS
jgi:cytochrome b561